MLKAAVNLIHLYLPGLTVVAMIEGISVDKLKYF